MRSGLVLMTAVAFVGAVGACKKPQPPQSAQNVSVGQHRVAIVLPAGWLVFNYGQRVVLKAPPLTDDEQRAIDYSGKLSFKSLGSVELHDMGPLNRMTSTGRVAETLPAFPELSDRALRLLEPDQRREIEFRKWASITGREGEEIGTWQRLTHTAPRRFLFISNGDNLFAATSGPFAGDESLQAYDAVRRSLQFLPAADADAARR